MPTSRVASSSPHAPIESDCEGGSGADGEAAAPVELDSLERRLLDEFQRDFPLVATPFATVAERLSSTEEAVLQALEALQARGYVSRVGAVFAPHRVGYSVLAALAVPLDRIDEVAALVSAYPEVNHNYEREHAYTLWFVVTGEDEAHVDRVLGDIDQRTGLESLRLPLEHAYHIDLGFPLWS